MDKHIHIICLDIPWPANYGGAIDMFYKIKALHEVGCQITLHCFQYGDRIPSSELVQHCTKVYYYPRQTGLKGLHYSLPYIVSSRRSQQLLHNLNMDEYPILFDGLHTTFLINEPALANRKKILRVHNIEATYYQHLGMQEKDFLKKLYYFFESGRLISYEKTLHSIDTFVSISKTEYDFFKQHYPKAKHSFIPAFHANKAVESLEGKGEYALYHGNLSVIENEQAALFLIKEVFSKTKFPLVVAGKNPSMALLQMQTNQIQIVANPTDDDMLQLLKKAHVHVLPAMQNTGLKLKLLHALYTGRFCICNANMLEGSNLENCVIKAESVEEWRQQLNQVIHQSFSNEDIKHRRICMESFDNVANAHRFLELF